MVKSSVMRFIEGNYALMGMDMDNSYDKGLDAYSDAFSAISKVLLQVLIDIKVFI